jgi:hypothetical protein
LAKCKYCNIQLKWKQPYKKGDRPVELSGKQHDCPKYVRKNKEVYGSFVPLNMEWRPIVAYCGKCGDLCECFKNFDEYCKKCDMFPQITFNSETFTPNPNVKPMMDSNNEEIFMKFLGIVGTIPTNWVHMKEDGTIKAGYKLTTELTDWFNKDGKSIIKDMNSQIHYTKKLVHHNE